MVCRNPSPGIATKARACKGASQEWSLKITFHVLGSVGECEEVNPHILKWAPTLGIGISMDIPNFQREITKAKTHWIKKNLYHWQALET
jgi:hypothetical protein